MNWVLDADICPEYHFFRCISQLTLSLPCNIVQLLSLFIWGFEGVYKQQFIYKNTTNHVSY